MPAISVVLPIYNGQAFLLSAIDSILSQSFTDLELLIIDDGSTDDSLAIASIHSDPRVRILRNSVNLGLPQSLNLAISHAKAELIARHDQDDIAEPQRLARQFDFLSHHSHVGLLGTWARVISGCQDGSGASSHEHRHPIEDSELRWRLLWNSPFVHSTVMMRREAFLRTGGYTTSQDRSVPEDYDLWVRMSRVCSMANIPEFLQIYRETPSGMSRERHTEIVRGVTRISCSLLGTALPHENDKDVKGLSLALNGQAQASITFRAALRRIGLLRRASLSVPGFRIREHLGAYSFTVLRVLRNSLMERKANQP